MDRNRNLRNRIATRIIDPFSNRFLNFSNRVLCRWIGGYQEVYFRMNVNKR
jgi:hypothetical protein